jgi:hypothetical protein
MSGVGTPKHNGLAFSLGQYYQFSTTTKSPVRVDNNGLIYYFGSAAKIKLGNSAMMVDDEGRVKVTATGSTMQQPPAPPEPQWKYTLNPPDNCGDTIIRNVYDTILVHKDGYHKAGAVPHQAFRVKAVYDVQQNLLNYRTLDLFSYRHVNYHKIQFLGAKMPMRASNSSMLSEAVKKVKSKLSPIQLAIETDVVNQVWTTEVEDTVNGKRTFIILSTMDGQFHVVPTNSPTNEQGQMTVVQTVKPAYPGWMRESVNVKEATAARNGKPPMEPILSWSVDSTGQHAIGCAVERTTFANLLQNQVLTPQGSYPEYRSEQVDIGPAKVFAEQAFFGEGDSEPLMIDRLGVVGLRFLFTLTGKEPADFTVNIHVERDTPPEDTSPIRVGIAYAKPVLGSPIEPDAIIELFMSFHESTDQLKFHRALDGIYGGEVPQYGEWLIKVGNLEYLKFPMQAILDKDDQSKVIKFGCLKHLIEATTIYTELENLDLSTLSFYRTVRARKPKLTRNVEETSSGAWKGKMNHLTKRCAVQTDAFVYGVIVDTKQAGNSELFALIESYLTSDYGSELTEWQPSVTYPLRANYRTFFTKPQSGSSFLTQGRIPPQWWGHVLFWPMWYVFLELVHKELAGDFSKGPNHDKTFQDLFDEFGYANDDLWHLDCQHGCRSDYPSLSAVNEDNFDIYYWYYVLNFGYGQTDITSTFALATFVLNGYEDHVYPDSWPINSMLATANPEWNGEMTDIRWLAKDVFLLLKEIFTSSIDADNNLANTVLNKVNNLYFTTSFYNFSNYEYFVGLCFAYFHAADSQWTNSMESFWMLDPGYAHRFEDHFVLRQYPWCWHFAIQNYHRFLINRGRNGLMVHPNGHYSLMHDFVDCPTGDEPEGEYWSYALSSEAFNHPDNPITDFRGGFENTNPPAISERDGFLMDQLAFWSLTDEAIMTSHVDMHNQAFTQNETLDDYKPNGQQLYSYWTDEKEPVIVYGGLRYPCHRFNNPFMQFTLSSEADTWVKEPKVALAYPRIAPLWGK